MKTKKDLVLEVEKIKFESIRILNANLSDRVGIVDSKQEIKEYEIGFSAENGLDIESKKIQFTLNFHIQAIDYNQKKIDVTGNFAIAYLYDFADLDLFISSNEEPIVMNALLASTLLGLAYSTSRGVIYNRCLGTVLEGFILPVVNPKELLNQE